MNRRSLIVDVHEPGDADNAVGMVHYEHHEVAWRCLLCRDRAPTLGLSVGLDGLLEHLEEEH